MELLTPSSIMQLGYQWNKDGVLRPKTQDIMSPLPHSALPNGPDPGTSYRTVNIFQEEQQRANQLYQEAKNSINTNVMIPGPPLPIFNKTDGAISQTLPVQFMSPAEMAANADSQLSISKQREYQREFSAPTNDMTLIGDQNAADAGGWAGIDLLGFPIQPAQFRHNNEVPFFGGKLTQSVDEFANKGIMETFTGQQELFRKKEEVPMSAIAPPVPNLTNPYGTSNLDGYNYDRYIVSNKRNNEAPTEQIRVGPGLNQGFTWKPSGGFQQANTRDYTLPKTTDQIRVLTKPKVSYAGRVISGKKIGKPGKIGLLQRYRPTSYFEQGPERYFVTTGQVKAGALRPAVNPRITNRMRHNSGTVGPAGPTTGSRMVGVRPKAAPVHKRSYRTDPVRNLQKRGPIPGINDPNSLVPNDYGKKSLRQIRCTQRPQLKQFPTKDLGRKSDANLGPKKPTKLRFTRKLFQIGNLHTNVNLSGMADKPARGPIQDPNQVARTTVKETTIHNERDGNLKGPNRGPVQDPNQIARTTVKETTIDNDRDGNLKGPNRGPIQDPNQIARTTTKETTHVQDYVGNIAPADRQDGTGYVLEQAGLDMKATERQFQLSSYTGGANRNRDAGYATADVKAPTTHRETTAVSYTGIAGPTNEAREPSRTATDASTSRSNREVIAQGRNPNRQGPKRIPFKQLVHLTTERNPDPVNCRLEARAPVPQDLNPTYATPSNQQTAITKERENVSNQIIADRLDPTMLDAFRNNPFTQSLASFFWP